ncbi:MAG: aldehyde dehydrogenase family protein, partial [Oligoflexia bacterium]|nr:aldehyde dehydrogenase family protein [Oligoflexia bacterium]
AFEYQGQKCSAASRAYIPRSLWATLKERLAAMIAEIKLGDISDFRNFMGAVIDKSSYDNIVGYIEYAKKSTDAKIVFGGEYDCNEGYFIQPTIVETTNPQFKLMQEEIFGPVLCVYVYDDNGPDQLAQVLRLVDETGPYALTGAVFAQDRQVINMLTRMLQNAAGNFYINDKPTGAVVGQQPFGGARASGTNDKAGSYLNLLRWASVRSIKENFVAVEDFKYPFMQES